MIVAPDIYFVLKRRTVHVVIRNHLLKQNNYYRVIPFYLYFNIKFPFKYKSIQNIKEETCHDHYH